MISERLDFFLCALVIVSTIKTAYEIALHVYSFIHGWKEGQQDPPCDT